MAVLAHNDTLCDYLHRLFNALDGSDVDHLHAARNSTTSDDVTWRHHDVTLTGSDGHGHIDGLTDVDDGVGSALLETVKFYLASVINPALCVFGMVGNIFNVMVLSRGQIKATLECSMELAAHTGLVALAVSDILYCACAFMDAIISRQRAVFDSYGPGLYVQTYATYFQNVFLHTGTWLTVVMAVGRYAAICRPLQARHLVGVRPTRIAVLLTFVVWTLLDLPKIWTYEVVVVDWCSPPGTRYYVLDHGLLVVRTDVKTAFTYVWALVGFFLPVMLLSYCNVHLIRALRESIRVRRLYRVSPRATSPGSRISPTLIAIVCMYLVLITPSELLHFYYYAVGRDSVEMFNAAIVVTNVLQTLNFAVNFVLYCIVNVHFRRTCFELVYRLCRCCCCCCCCKSSSASASLSSRPFGHHARADSNRRSSSSAALRCGSQHRLRRSWHNSSAGSNYCSKEYCAAHASVGRPTVWSDGTGCETAL